MPPCRRLTLKPTGGETGEVCETRPEWFHTSPVSPPVAWPVVSCLTLPGAASVSGLRLVSGLSVRSQRDALKCTAHWSPQLTARTLGELWRYTLVEQHI